MVITFVTSSSIKSLTKPKKTMTTKFYCFNQNNSGGRFDNDGNLAARLFIEANNEEQAIEIAKKNGVYFDGVDNGMDCSCCGDRWYTPDEIVLPYEFGILSLERAQEACKKHNIVMKPDRRGYSLLFEDVVSYAKYLVNEYSGTYSIIYLNSEVVKG